MADDTCRLIRQRIAALGAELKRLVDALRNETFADQRARLQEQIDSVSEQIDHQRALLDEFGCNITLPPPPPPPPPPPDPGLNVVGIEATQAIQFFNFNSQGSGTGPDNSVSLVAQKATLLRFYIDTYATGVNVVSGEMSYHGFSSHLYPINREPGQTIGRITAQAASSINRGNLDHTLNFLIPAEHCVGDVRFEYEIYLGFHAGTPEFYRKGSYFATFVNMNKPQIHGVLVRYTGNDAMGNPTDIAAPSQSDFINTLDSWVRYVFPISSFNYTGFEVITDSGDFTNQTGSGCGTGWDDLLTRLRNMRTLSNSNSIYVAMLPSGVPMGFTGCGGSGLVAAGGVGDGSTLAQEISHAYGRQHAPSSVCGQNPANVDPSYPNYALDASIGEFGLDRSSNPPRVHNPGFTWDYMSYCSPVWVSPYTYQGLMNSIGIVPPTPGASRQGVRDEYREFLFLNFRLHRDGHVELQPSFHLPALSSDVATYGGERRSSVTLELLDERDQVIYFHRCYSFDPHAGDEDAPYLDLHEAIPWDARVKSIRFLRNGNICHTLVLPEQPPEVRIRQLATDEWEKNQMKIEWTAEDHELPLTYTLRYSHDGGQTWRAVAANLTESHYVVNLDLLPGGEQCKFQAVTSAGVHTAVAETESFTVAPKPMKAHILSPQSGATFTQGELVTLRGTGVSPNFGTADFQDLVWTSNRDGFIGTGYEVTTQDLSIGRHKLTINFPDRLEGETSASVFIAIEPGSSG